MKKKYIVGGIVLIILAAIFYHEITARIELNQLVESIEENQYTIQKSADGNSGRELSSEKIEALLSILVESDFHRDIHILPKGGWGYYIDIEVEDEVTRVVFSQPDSISINSATYTVDTIIE